MLVRARLCGAMICAATLLPITAIASTVDCADPASRLVTAQQFLLQHLPQGAEMEKFMLQQDEAAASADGCALDVRVTVAFIRASHYPALENALNAESTLEVTSLEERNDGGGKSRMTFRLQIE